MTDYEAAVIGAGPGGLSTVAALLDTGITRILWIDKAFEGGRLNTLYREISSYVTPWSSSPHDTLHAWNSTLFPGSYGKQSRSSELRV